MQLQSPEADGPSSLKSSTEHLIQKREPQKDLAEEGNLVRTVENLKQKW